MDNEMNLNDAQINQVDDQLEHWGIKGMRWGIRRYQNPDGSLTPAGKKRYADEVGKLKAKNEKLDAKIRAKKLADRQTARVEKLKAEAAAKKAQLKGQAEDVKAKKKQAKADAAEAKAKAKADKKDKELEDSLTRKDLEMQTKKAKILRSGDPVEILKNGHMFTDQEIESAYNRLTAENKLKSLIPEKQSVLFLKKAYSDIVVPVAKDVAGDYIKEQLGLNKPNAKALADIEKVKADTAKVLAETREKNAQAREKEFSNQKAEKAAKAQEEKEAKEKADAAKAEKEAAKAKAEEEKRNKKLDKDLAKALNKSVKRSR